MTIGNICNREVIIAFKNQTVAEAVKLMREHHVGDLVIVEQRDEHNVPIGIVTDREILISVVGEGLDPARLLIQDVMSAELVTASVDDSLEASLAAMKHKGVRRLPVVGHDQELVGILTLDDVIDLLAEEIGDLAAMIRQERRREERKTVP